MKGNKFLRFFKTKIRILIVWISVFLFLLFLFWENSLFSLVRATYLTICLILVSLIESKFMVKYFLLQGRNFMFYFLNFLLITISSFITVVIEFNMSKFISDLSLMNLSQPSGIKTYILPYLIRFLMFTATVAISAISNLQVIEKENQKIRNMLKNEKLDMELRYLKSQINPHFLFNALNNIYSLVYTHDNKASQSVIKLSEMLRYVMLDCQVDTISIEKEVKYIDTYIDFQLMRMENSHNVTFDKDIQHPDFKIPPMILQPLVENSFKHSRLESVPDSFIHFSIKQENHSMTFTACNSVKNMTSTLLSDSGNKNYSGIGIQNVKKRLEFYYGKDYMFQNKLEDNKYFVIIKIVDNKYEKEI